jgi:SAM-dependent methyltransferase
MKYRKSLNTSAEMADWYKKKYRDMGGCWHTPTEEHERHLNDAGLSAEGGGRLIVDIGCGDGSFLARAAARGFSIAGFELVQADDLKIPTGDLFVVDIGEDLPAHWYGACQFVLSLGSLEHVVNIEKALCNIRDMLATDGRWYFYVPNERWIHEDQPNERTATADEWAALFAKYGLAEYRRFDWGVNTALGGTKFVGAPSTKAQEEELNAA